MLLQNSEGGGVTQPTTRPDQDLSGNPKRGGDLKVSCYPSTLQTLCKCQHTPVLDHSTLPEVHHWAGDLHAGCLAAEAGHSSVDR
jgi:hypothetical protein